MAAVVAASGCGGDGDQETVTTSSLNRAQFVMRADAVCRRERKDIIEEIGKFLSENPSDGLPKSEQYANMVRAVYLPTVESQIEAVRELGAPAGDERRVDAILAAQQDAVDEVAELESIESFGEVQGHFAEAAKMSKTYGFTSCSIGLAPG